MVSNVSSIGQYINEENGYITHPVTAEVLAAQLAETFTSKSEALKEKATKAYETASGFTFERYNERITGEILHMKQL